MTLLRLSALVAVFSCSLSLLACSAGTAEGDDTPGAVAQPLLETCSGSYVCTADDSRETTTVTLSRNSINMCMAGSVVFHKDQDVTTTPAATRTSESGRATRWPSRSARATAASAARRRG